MMAMVSAWVFLRVKYNNFNEHNLETILKQNLFEKSHDSSSSEHLFFFNQWPLLMNHQLGGILQIQKSSPSHLSYFRDTLITMKKMVCKERLLFVEWSWNNSILLCCVRLEKDNYWYKDPFPGKCCYCTCTCCKLQVWYRKHLIWKTQEAFSCD